MSFAILVTADLLLTGCGLTDVAHPATPVTVDRSYRPPAAPLQIQAAACLDGTLSLGRDAVQQELTAVTSAVHQWVEPAGSPGLDLQIRKVDGASYGAPDAAHITLPALATVPRAPEASDENFIAADRYRRQLLAERPAQLVGVRSAVAQAVASIRGLDLTASESEISGCLSAAIETLDPTRPRRLLLWSDLRQEGSLQLAGDFRGVPLLVVHVCGRDANQCTAQERAFALTVTERHGVAHFLRPERAQQAVPAFLKTGVVR